MIPWWLLWLLRQARYRSLDLLTGGQGLPVAINGQTVRLTPDCWRSFPHEYEPEVQEAFERWAQPGACVLDVGAHVGVHSVALARLVGPAGCVVAFEPAPRTAALLRRHARLNGLGTRILVVESIVGDRIGVAPMWVGSGGADPGNGLLSAPDKPGRTLLLPTTTLDAFCSAQGLHPRLIKIDVEGCEGRVIEGARAVLSTDPKPTVVCAMHPWHLRGLGSSEEEVLGLAHELGFEVLDFQGRPTGPTGEGREVILAPA